MVWHASLVVVSSGFLTITMGAPFWTRRKSIYYGEKWCHIGPWGSICDGKYIVGGFSNPLEYEEFFTWQGGRFDLHTILLPI